MEKIKVGIVENKNYEIVIGKGILDDLVKHISAKHKDKKIVIITDDTINGIYGNDILKVFKKLNPDLISVPAGEISKSRTTKEEIEDMLFDKQYSRDSLLIAFGGGVIGDLVGYLASTFNRGIPYIQLPTSLLAMVDSSIGGKTGINVRQGKNLIGTIWQPDSVFIDLDFITKLPKEEFLNGLCEIIKSGAGLDKDLFSFIEKNDDKIIKRDENSLIHIIKRTVELKKEVVEKDERESGLRQVLNLGHTIGHGIEAYSGFKLKHGFSVSIGMVVEARISAITENLKQKDEERLISLLKKFELPISVGDVETNRIIEFMKVDKKTRKQKPRFVLIDGIGSIKKEKDKFSFEVDEMVVKEAIESCK